MNWCRMRAGFTSEQDMSKARSFAIQLTILLFLPLFSLAQKVYTVAGGYVGDGGPATLAGLASPQSAVFDAQGNLLFTDSLNCLIRKVDAQGNISSIAGTGICGFSGDGGPATQAKLRFPWGLALDAAGNLFLADEGNQRIREIDINGIITTIAGKGKVGFCGDGGPAVNACLRMPTAVTVKGSGTNAVIYFADMMNHRVRRVVMKTGIINTVAGNGQADYCGDGGPAKKACLNRPQGVAFDSRSDVLWISDTWNGAIRRLDFNTGIITTFVSPNCELLHVCSPLGIELDRDGNLHVADVAWVLKVAVPTGDVTFEAGTESQGFNGDGHKAVATVLNNPSDVALDSTGNLFIVDSGNSRIRRGAYSQNVSTVAGGYIGDGGPAKLATLNWPMQFAFDAVGNMYLADAFNNRIRKVTPTGKISTFAGTGMSGYTGDGGPARKATLDLAEGIALDKNGNLFIGDTPNSVIRKVDATGTITTFSSNYFLLQSLATDSGANVYAADWCLVWKIAPNGERNIVAGGDQCGYNGDEIPATEAYLSYLVHVGVDSQDNLYIADMLNQRVRVVDKAGIIHTIAGNGTCGFSGDGGPADAAMLCHPSGVAVGSQQNVYIADESNGRIRVVNGSRQINTLAGTGKYGYNGEGRAALRTNINPVAVGVGPNGVVYYSDFAGYRVRKIQ